MGLQKYLKLDNSQYYNCLMIYCNDVLLPLSWNTMPNKVSSRWIRRCRTAMCPLVAQDICQLCLRICCDALRDCDQSHIRQWQLRWPDGITALTWDWGSSDDHRASLPQSMVQTRRTRVEIW